MRKILNAGLPNALLGTATAHIAASMPVPWDEDWHSAVEGPSSEQEGRDRLDDSSDPQSSDLMDMSPRRGRNSPTRTVEMASPSSTRTIPSPVTHLGDANTLASPSDMSDMSTGSMPFAPLPRDGAGSPTPGSSTRLRARPLASGSPGQPGGNRTSRLQRLNEHGERFYPEVQDLEPDTEEDTESEESKD
ncbi:unnamed protein product [Cyclocybe aegerita]|uniref:Uncharacterized protein n=1 Tax=Cyclocybe aegerita TaxID=1973307 RepID=A0A8S0VXY4_CYCAE|nr:unnamed protein product [Cyclocybe aegerita]